MRCKSRSLSAGTVDILTSDASLTLAVVGLGPLFDADGLDCNETGGIGGLEATELVHGGLLGVVETLLGLTALDDDVALVELEPDDTVDGPLGGRDRAGDELALGGEEVTVVEDSAERDGGELVTESTDVPVKGETLEVNVGGAEDSGAGGLVASARLDTDESVLDDIDTADTVLPAEGVQGIEDIDGVGVDLVVSDNLDGETGLKLNRDTLGSGGGGLEGAGKLPHVIGRGGVGVLEDTGLVGDVEQVLVGGPGLGGGLDDGDVLLGGVLEESLATGEAVVENGDPPGSDDLDVGLQAVEGKLESDLIVTLSSATMGDEVATFLLSNLNHATGDDRAGQRSSEKVDVLVDAVGLDSWVDELSDELALEVLEEELLSSDLESLDTGSFKVFFLTNIGHERIDFITLLNQPGEDA